MRIGIALLVLCDLLIRTGDLRAHYTDQGIWPTALIYNFGWNAGYWSLHALNGTYSLELFLFILHFGFALCLLLGFKTRLFTVLTWLLTISLQNRNLYVLQAGDDLLRLVLLWGIFLPWNACYALDAKKYPVRRKQAVLANLGYLLLLASVYFFSVNLKSSSEWQAEGSAVYYALSLEQLRLLPGDWIYHQPLLLKILTWLVIGVEYLVVPLILLPSRKGGFRFLAFVLLLLLHLGIGLTLYVGLFFMIGIVSAIGLLPSFVMDRLEKMLRIKKKAFFAPKPAAAFFKWIANGISMLIIFLCLMVNLGTVSWFPLELQDQLAYTCNGLRLNQYWGMFSPGVLKKDGWFVYYGIDSVGRQWDLRRNEDYVDFAKPGRIVTMYKNDRWRKLAENMQNDRYTFLRPLYCKYIIHKWNKDHPEKKIASLSVYFMEKENLPDYKSTEPFKNLHCICYDD